MQTHSLSFIKLTELIGFYSAVISSYYSVAIHTSLIQKKQTMFHFYISQRLVFEFYLIIKFI